MVRVVRHRVQKDGYGDLSHHLRNHIHLTNCIHLKNHMHKNSPILTDASFMRDLAALQRSRPLKDPSTSPSSWQSPAVISLMSKGEGKDKSLKQKGGHTENPDLTKSDLVDEVRLDRGDAAPFQFPFHGKKSQNMQIGEEAETSMHGYHRGLNRVKRRKYRSSRTQTAKATTDEGAQRKMSVASNSLAQSSAHQKYPTEGREEEYDEQNVTRGSRNGCGGIPWNLSSIHHRGRSFLDMAGRSLPCGQSDTKLKKGGSPPGREDLVDSNSSIRPDTEALPLLVEASGSQQRTHNADWTHDYSGELGIYARDQLNHEIDSDIALETNLGDHHRLRRRHNHRHQTLTQKYTPRTFRDMVGHHLVAQALLNAVARRKIGLVYVFYGPQGTGKTSCARVFARAMNCQSVEQMKPCGFCNFCKAYDMGKSRNIREIGPVSNFDFERIMGLLDNMIVSHFPSQYRVFIFDDCDTISTNCWSALSKVIDRAPRRVVFILVCSSLDVLPHVIISSCQKFLFPKLKDAEITRALLLIATKEDLEIDKDALKLIASRSDGSLRDAEMMLEQLSLLGQRITVPLVQELVGLISDEKLLCLLDLALSADTVNTVKLLREIMESGVNPLALMSQLATVITDILAGTYDLAKERSKRKFFRRQALSNEHMEKLRQALKTLSEAEKQMRMSNERLTWLTAALLQLAPDQQYMLPNSSADTNFDHGTVLQGNGGGRERHKKCNVEHAQMKGNNTTDRRYDTSAMIPEQSFSLSADINKISGRLLSDIVYKDVEQIWLEVLEKIQISRLKEFMYQEGKLISVSFDKAPIVQLMFSSQLTKSKAENYRANLLQAFESVLGSPVRIEIRCELKDDARAGLAGSNGMTMEGYNDISKRILGETDGLNQAHLSQSDSLGLGRSHIEIASPKEAKGIKNKDKHDVRDLENALVGESETLPEKSCITSLPEQRLSGEQSQRMSLVRSKVTLAQVIQQAERCAHRNEWSNRKTASIAEKIEQENLKLEPRTRSLLCWKASRRRPRLKSSRSKMRTRKPITLLRFVSCGKCLSSKSPSSIYPNRP